VGYLAAGANTVFHFPTPSSSPACQPRYVRRMANRTLTMDVDGKTYTVVIAPEVVAANRSEADIRAVAEVKIGLEDLEDGKVYIRMVDFA